MKKLILLFTLFTLTSCVDVKPNITVDQTIDLHIDGENVEGLEGEWVITTDEDNDVITIKIEKKEEVYLFKDKNKITRAETQHDSPLGLDFAFCVLRLIGRPVAASAGSTICASVRLTPLVFAASLHEQIS